MHNKKGSFWKCMKKEMQEVMEKRMKQSEKQRFDIKTKQLLEVFVINPKSDIYITGNIYQTI